MRLRYAVSALATVACIGAGAAWAATNGGTTTTPGATTTTPGTTTTPSPTHHCPNMGSGSSGASYAPAPTNL
jgi:hypothetical protein